MNGGRRRDAHVRPLPDPARLVAVERPGGVLWVRVARRFLQRAVGLLGSRELPADQGLLILPCGSIHTWGMRYAIDALFLDAEARVLEIRRQLAPWRAARCRHAHAVLELAAGTAHHALIRPGDQLPELLPWIIRS